MNTLAYAVFAESGNIQIWCSDPIQAETLRQKHGNDLVSLIDKNELSALEAAFRAYDAIPKNSSHFSTPEKDKAMALVVREVAMLFHGQPASDIKNAGLHGDVARIVRMLESREWADHVTKTSLGDRLHSEVSELLGRVGSPAARHSSTQCASWLSTWMRLRKILCIPGSFPHPKYRSASAMPLPRFPMIEHSSRALRLLSW